MRKLVTCLLAAALTLTCAMPLYAKSKRKLNPEARAAQKRAKAQQKAMKRQAKARQKEIKRQQATR